MRFIATSTPLSEKVTAEELEELGAAEAVARPGKVFFEASPEKACELAFNLRTARRVMMPLRRFRFDSRDAFYSEAKRIEWEEIIDPSRTFAVRVKGEDDSLKNTSFAALVVKDAVVDRIRDRKGARPSVDKEDPDVSVLAHIEKGSAEVSLDLGGPLHKRGYRRSSSPGSLNETLAATMLRLSGYDGGVPFLDPMAGSGTITIEAAMISAGMAPGLLWKLGRGFFSLPIIPEGAKKEIVKRARERFSAPKRKISLSDIDPSSVKVAAANARNAKVAAFIEFGTGDFFALGAPPEAGLLLTNTPYGDHLSLGGGARDFFGRVGDKLKRDFSGYDVGLLLGGAEAVKAVGLRAFRKISLYNGSREVKLCFYELYRGSRKKGKDIS